MKAIAKPVYENLTAEQRVRAAVSAVARGDESEAKKLRETCPKHTYRMNESAFTDRMESLMLLSLAVECDQRGAALDFLRASYQAREIDPKDTKALLKNDDIREDILRDIASIDQAWPGKPGNASESTQKTWPRPALRATT